MPNCVAGLKLISVKILLHHPALCRRLGGERTYQAGTSITALLEVNSVHDHHSLGLNCLTGIPILFAILTHPFVPGDFSLH
jgi:hypothetical protein